MPHEPSTIHLLGFIASGEMSVDDLPLPPGADERLAALTHGDTDPLSVVVGVGVGKGGRGWRYTAPYLKKFVDRVNDTGMAGILGHQKDEDLGHQFVNPVTHWLAAKWDPAAPVVDVHGKPTGEHGVAYFRGVVDKHADNLKRWIRGRMITQPSIFGKPMRRINAAGEQEVYDGEPLSIDWAPLGRAGMLTSGVMAFGEMDAIGGEPPQESEDDPRGRDSQVTLQEALTELRTQGATPDQVVRGLNWRAADVVPALVATDRRGLAEALPREVLSGVAAGEIAAAQRPADLLEALKMPLSEIAGVVDKTSWDSLQAEHKTYGEMVTLLGLEPTSEPGVLLQRVKELRSAGEQAQRSALQASVEKSVASGEMAIPAVLRPMVTEQVLTRVTYGDDEAKIKTAIGEVKALPTIKPLIDANLGNGYVAPQPPSSTRAQGEMNGHTEVGLPVRRRSIY